MVLPNLLDSSNPINGPGNNTEVAQNQQEKWLKIWFGVGYSLSLFVFFFAMNTNLYFGRKTTLRIFFINYNAMGIIWSFDSLVCTLSDVYSDAGESLHL